MPDLFSALLSGPFGILFGLVVLIVIANWVKMARNGVNPFTAEATIVSKLANSQALSPEKSIESRLSELDQLLAAGKISADEHKAARLKVLSD